MTLPILVVETDGELEIPAAVVGPVPAGTKFNVSFVTFAPDGTLPERRGFLLTEDPSNFD